MTVKPTHRENKNPQITLENLALLVTESEANRRKILVASKFPELVMLNYYKPSAPTALSFLASGPSVTQKLLHKVTELEIETAKETNQWKIDRLENNVFFLKALETKFPRINFPRHSSRSKSNRDIGSVWHGVEVKARLHIDFEHQRKSSNVISVGGLVYRYKKNKMRNTPEQSEIQAAFIYQRLLEIFEQNGGIQPQKRLCGTLDIRSSVFTPAPGKAKTQYNNLKNACLNISEQWNNLAPPKNAIIA